jgi:phytoene dehydrogenase-like protein
MPEVLIGNNFAVLVAAAELGASGRDVVVLTDGRPPGGHFRGLRVDGVPFDVGMVVLEQTGGSPGEVPDPTGYRPDRRYDWTRFGPLVDQWLARHATLRRTPTPQTLVEGRRWPDHLLTDRLDVLAVEGLVPPPPLSRDDPAHASGKVTAPAYDTLTYTEAARSNHGAELHGRLVAPFAHKVLGPLEDELLARFHRAAWLPLYWPETLAAAAAGRPTGVPEHPFFTTDGGFVGDVVTALDERLQQLPNVVVDGSEVTALERSDGAWQVRTGSGGRWSTGRPVLGLGGDRAAQLLGAEAAPRAPGAPVVVVCCLVRGAAVRAPVACLTVVDPQFTTYRVTDQDLLAGRDPEWRRVVVESGHVAVDRASAGADVTTDLVGELCRLLDVDPVPSPGGGLRDVRVVRTVTAARGVAIPTAQGLAADAAALADLVEACPEALLTGALLGSGVGSLSDQVVQGLAVARQLS